MEFPYDATYMDQLRGALDIWNREDAQEYLGILIQLDMQETGCTYEEAHHRQVVNLGYACAGSRQGEWQMNRYFGIQYPGLGGSPPDDDISQTDNPD